MQGREGEGRMDEQLAVTEAVDSGVIVPREDYEGHPLGMLPLFEQKMRGAREEVLELVGRQVTLGLLGNVFASGGGGRRGSFVRFLDACGSTGGVRMQLRGISFAGDRDISRLGTRFLRTARKSQPKTYGRCGGDGLTDELELLSPTPSPLR